MQGASQTNQVSFSLSGFMFFMASLLGVSGLVMKSRPLIISYAIMLLLCVSVGVGLGVVFWIHLPQIGSEITERLHFALNSRYGAHNDTTEMVDVLQTRFGSWIMYVMENLLMILDLSALNVVVSKHLKIGKNPRGTLCQFETTKVFPIPVALSKPKNVPRISRPTSDSVVWTRVSLKPTEFSERRD